MARFAIRPEINGAVDGDYEKLHEEMYLEGFYRVIYSRSNLTGLMMWFDLPSGLYVAELELSNDAVHQKAMRAVEKVANQAKPNKGYELITFEYKGATSNLKLNKDKNKLPPGAKPNS